MWPAVLAPACVTPRVVAGVYAPRCKFGVLLAAGTGGLRDTNKYEDALINSSPENWNTVGRTRVVWSATHSHRCEVRFE